MSTNSHPGPARDAQPAQPHAPTVPASVPAPRPAWPQPQPALVGMAASGGGALAPARQTAAPASANGLAVAGLVLGVLSLGLDVTIIGCALGVPVGIIGCVLSVFGAHASPRRMAIAGGICAGLGVVVPFVVFLILTLARG